MPSALLLAIALSASVAGVGAQPLRADGPNDALLAELFQARAEIRALRAQLSLAHAEMATLRRQLVSARAKLEALTSIERSSQAIEPNASEEKIP